MNAATWNRYTRNIFFLPLLLLAGCKVGPRYHKPQVKLPEKFVEQKNAKAIAALANWWHFFDDPYLNDLIKKAIEKNYDLRLAVEKIQETRFAYKLQNAKLYPEVDVTGQVSQSRLSKNVAQNNFFQSKN